MGFGYVDGAATPILQKALSNDTVSEVYLSDGMAAEILFKDDDQTIPGVVFTPGTDDSDSLAKWDVYTAENNLVKTPYVIEAHDSAMLSLLAAAKAKSTDKDAIKQASADIVNSREGKKIYSGDIVDGMRELGAGRAIQFRGGSGRTIKVADGSAGVSQGVYNQWEMKQGQLHRLRTSTI